MRSVADLFCGLGEHVGVVMVGQRRTGIKCGLPTLYKQTYTNPHSAAPDCPQTLTLLDECRQNMSTTMPLKFILWADAESGPSENIQHVFMPLKVAHMWLNKHTSFETVQS